VKSLLLAVTFGGGLATPAAELPELVIPAGVGVNIHFVTGHEQDLDMIAAAGFKFIRMDFHWAAVERKKGEYDWSGYDELTANLEKRGIRALYILDYSNPLYEESVASQHPITGQPHRTTASPQHPASIAAFARWAAAAANHFRGRKVIWEIWNEPNGHFWAPKPDAQQYTALALGTAKAIREADTNATVIGPATSGMPLDFLESFLRSGVLEYLDGVSVHPYRRSPPETAAGEYEKVRALIDRFAPPARHGKIPILSGEWGYSTDGQDVSLETQASYIARQQLFNLLNGIPLSIWYDWKNDGHDPKEREHNFGTVMPDLKLKPAYLAIQTLTRELSGYRMARRHRGGSEQDYVLVLANKAGESKLAAWTLAEPHPVAVNIGGRRSGEIPVVSGAGHHAKAKIDKGQLGLELTATPQYAALGRRSLKP